MISDQAAVSSAVAIFSFCLVIVGWLIRLERRFGRTLTREEHTAICTDRERRVLTELEQMKLMANERERYTLEHRQIVYGRLQVIGEDLAYFQGQLQVRRREPLPPPP